MIKEWHSVIQQLQQPKNRQPSVLLDKNGLPKNSSLRMIAKGERREEEALLALEASPLTVDQLAHYLGLSVSGTRAVIRRLKGKDLISLVPDTRLQTWSLKCPV